MNGLFLICLAVRYSLAYLARSVPIAVKPMGFIAVLIALGFTLIYVFGLRPVGVEAGGRIWWNSMRPLHALMYGLFAYYAFTKPDVAWVALLADAILGSFIFGYHYMY